MDLLRAILLKVEELPFVRGRAHKLELAGYTEDEIYYHTLLAKDEDLIEASFHWNGTDFYVTRLTYQGHEFLDLARDDTRWNNAKEKVKSTTGTLTVEGLKLVLGAMIQAALKTAMSP
jgi:Hypothetical protein (DUF2513)